MSKPALFALTALTLALPVLAAADGAEYKRSGWYAGLGASGIVHLFDDEIEKHFGKQVDMRDAVGLNARAGYRLASWFAAELQYEWVPGLDLVTDELTFDVPGFPGNPVTFPDSDLATLTAHTVTLNGKLLLPVRRIHPYLLGGVGFVRYHLHDLTNGFAASQGLDFEHTATAFAGRVGLGSDFYITENFLLNLEITAVLSTLDLTDPAGTGNLSALHTLSSQFGLQWRF